MVAPFGRRYKDTTNSARTLVFSGCKGLPTETRGPLARHVEPLAAGASPWNRRSIFRGKIALPADDSSDIPDKYSTFVHE